MEKIQTGQYSVLRTEGNGIAVYTAEEESVLEVFEKAYPQCFFVSLQAMDWERDFSPWPSEKVFRSGRSFQGGADAFIETLKTEIMPMAEMNRQVDKRLFIGYSLAGLFGLYLGTKTELFSGIASVSGSLWYPGFVDYLRNNPIHAEDIYLSLGDQEHLSKSPVLQKVDDCTKQTEEILKTKQQVVFEKNPGGHFNDPSGREMKAINWLLQKH